MASASSVVGVVLSAADVVVLFIEELVGSDMDVDVATVVRVSAVVVLARELVFVPVSIVSVGDNAVAVSVARPVGPVDKVVISDEVPNFDVFKIEEVLVTG